MNSLKEGAVWHVDPLLGNVSANKHVSTATREYSGNGRDISNVVRAKMLQAGPISFRESAAV
jgi:hypothetical protein